MELASCHPYAAYSFAVSLRFLENLRRRPDLSHKSVNEFNFSRHLHVVTRACSGDHNSPPLRCISSQMNLSSVVMACFCKVCINAILFVCVSVCVWVSEWVCVSVWVRVCVWVWECVWEWVCECVCVREWVWLCESECECVWVCVRVSVCVREWVWVCVRESECVRVSVCVCVFPMAQQPLVDQGLLIVEASRSHSDTPHSVGLLWTSDRSDAETST
jgi:hypothetical protein